MDPWREQIRHRPEDWDLRMVYADWLDDQGEHVLATGQRWQGKNRKRPQQLPDFTYWYDQPLEPDIDPESDLPGGVFIRLMNGVWYNGTDPGHRIYGSVEEAEKDLAEALQKG